MLRNTWKALVTIALGIVVGHVVTITAANPRGQFPNATHRGLHVVRSAEAARAAAQAQTAATGRRPNILVILG